MEIAYKYGNFIESYIEIEPEVLRLDQPTNSKNSLTPMDAADKTASYLGAKIGLDALVAVALSAGIVICAILTDLGMV
ncbi:MAG: hypothetical protein K2L48_03815 [Mycoplasmoidaceae bacterium]|nr:hypothetical protein [Mycoplasmoidaceae bacterium]